MPLIEAFVGWFSNGSNLIAVAQVLAAVVTAVATFALWRATRVLAVETTALAKMSAHPFVVSYLESGLASPTALNLIVMNTGNATAFDIALSVEPALPAPSGEKDTTKTVTEHQVSLIPPGQRRSLQGVLSRQVLEQNFTITLGWASRPGDSQRDKISYVIEAKDGYRAGWDEKGLHHVVGELEALRKALQAGSR